ncbi:hypothetical protein SAPIO_CDS1346 [Scedosporium apiospermum]|uniref:Stress-response A/B barrel domain-containing protein n=1 Tax=Pseudallescheria apiosperma TaxID=563466 RepID=A0A084GF45_PSEDA|nr:uncharacterized protein SAPIO_CDS1346 [Scedosporium apiospermum]KEZ45957.1 hypothetical protein SAPIO_CDS1346 [Scedosporium apiospermum]
MARQHTALKLILLLALLILLYLAITSDFSSLISPATLPLVPQTVTHIVLFQFKSSVDNATIKKVYNRMLSLKHECLHPVRSKPYIRSVKGGIDNSPEGLQNGITHAFVVEFASVWDRDYYIRDDPAHKAFVEWVGSAVENAIVVDFSLGRLE